MPDVRVVFFRVNNLKRGSRLIACLSYSAGREMVAGHPMSTQREAEWYTHLGGGVG